ncbi:MAG: cation-translocating P-type ATPase [Saprospiraceae bacterium]|nr:cation-translocating P-type ATPase [Saprospiraceae bacterium]
MSSVLTEKQAMSGLTGVEVAHRMSQFGRNEIIRKNKIHPWTILINQFSSPLILILIAAAVLSITLGYLPNQEPKAVDAVLIMSIVVLSGLFGFFQDYRAEKTIEALREMATPLTRVIRDGIEQEIPATQIVPGDLLVLEAGDIIAADGSILENLNLQVDESVLTGESIAVRKKRDDDVFMNTHVTSGRAKVNVVSTGMQTRVGEIAGELQEIKQEKTSFQKELSGLGKKLSLLTLVITIVIGAVGYYKYGLYQGLMTAISLAVAAIPEGLPAVVVLALAIGAGYMVRKNALIRRLSIAESVGAVDLICTDKTGTLTKNEMTVTKLFYDGKIQDLKMNAAASPEGTFRKMIESSLFCNNVENVQQQDGSQLFLGEQTEIAIYQFASKFSTEILVEASHKIHEIPFDSERKMMSVVFSEEGQDKVVYAKGAPEILVEKCDRIMMHGDLLPLDASTKAEIIDQNTSFGSQALRVIGFAYKPTNDLNQLEEDLIWIGLEAMIDLPRPEVKEAIADCHTAGIRVIMITGDNPTTAQAIADEVGMDDTDTVISGDALDKMSDPELRQNLKDGVNIFARTTPFHKLRILEILEEHYSVAMTGDGVNDALAIKRASVGIAMGKKGTEVTKQVSDIILLDDNFTTIRDAIRQGRTIFQNIRKFIDYLLTCNIAEVLVIFIATLYFDLEGPVLLAVQILWINLLTDGLVAISLGADPPAQDTMQHPPRQLNEPLINRHLTWLIGLVGIKLMIILFAAFWLTLPMGLDKARTVLLTGFVLFEFVRIGAIRYEEKLGWWDNRWLVGALLLSVALQLSIVYTPINTFFSLVPLGWYEWGILLAGSVLGYVLAIAIARLLMKYVPN